MTMKDYRTIVVGTDGSDLAAPTVARAAWLARRDDADLVIICAFAELSRRDEAKNVATLGGDTRSGQVLGRVGRGIGHHREDVVEVAVDAALVAAPAQVVVREIAGDLAQPGQEAGAVAQPRQMGPGVEEGLLRDVLAGRHVAGDGQRDGGDAVLAAADDAAVGAGISRLCGRQVFVDQEIEGFGAVHGGRCGCEDQSRDRSTGTM